MDEPINIINFHYCLLLLFLILFFPFTTNANYENNYNNNNNNWDSQPGGGAEGGGEGTIGLTNGNAETISVRTGADNKQHFYYGDTDEETSAEHALYNALLGGSRYQKHVRPVRNHQKPIVVRVGMAVMMIEELVERDQIMVMAACVKMIWEDEFLTWNPNNYDNLTWMAVSSTSLWLPDIAIINSPEPYSLTRKVTNVDLNFKGEIGYFPSGRLATRCNLQITCKCPQWPLDHVMTQLIFFCNRFSIRLATLRSPFRILDLPVAIFINRTIPW